MQPKLTNAWIHVGIELAKNSTKKMLCPECGEANLVVLDVLDESKRHLERHMNCPNCGATNAILLRNLGVVGSQI
jgi:predicted RNA-binding Zn-ribbon protein involved in translation (DUF1610 family)